MVISKAFTIKTNPNNPSKFSLHLSSSESSSQSSNNNNKNNIQKPQNEFSRTIRTEIILSPRTNNRRYKKDISATNDELSKLAKRFSLSKISKLDANLLLTKDNVHSSSSGVNVNASSGSNRRSAGSYSGGECIQVQGDVIAHVTQTCVRTNEDFDVDLEFSILAVVRASNSNGDSDKSMMKVGEQQELGGTSLAQIEAQLSGGGGGRGGKRNKGKKKNRVGSGNSIFNTSLNEMNMKQIENMLQEYESNDDIFEDENVLGADGLLDVGELVAQMFRLKLDPYPKKPGSEPVRYSISG